MNKKTARINAVCEKELVDQLEKLSKLTDISYSTLIRKALREYLNRELSKKQ